MGAALAILGRVPAIAWVLIAVVAWGGWQRWRAIDARDDFDRAKQAAAAEQAASAAAAAAESSRRLKAVQESADAAHIQAQANRAAADRARRAGDELRQRIAAIQAGGRPGNPAASSQCAAAWQAVDMLADVLRRGEARIGELAAYADSARTAGEACERAYIGLDRSR